MKDMNKIMLSYTKRILIIIINSISFNSISKSDIL